MGRGGWGGVGWAVVGVWSAWSPPSWHMLGKVEIKYKAAVKSPMVSDGVLAPSFGSPWRESVGLGSVSQGYWNPLSTTPAGARLASSRKS